ncbi:MAG: hypothetical protein IKX92_01365 [Clostridia bacterium]|nr:hypothetical protein [Clostridia bacterium]
MKYSKEICVSLLREKGAGTGALPKKSDFTPEEVMAIKAFLGPWPRALEAAGLKEPGDAVRAEHNREKRIRAKRKLNRLKTIRKKERRGIKNEEIQ